MSNWEQKDDERFWPKAEVFKDRSMYLGKMFAAGLRPVCYILTGQVFPDPFSAARVTGHSPSRILRECLAEGNFRLFPEGLFWLNESMYITPQVRNLFSNVLDHIQKGQSWVPTQGAGETLFQVPEDQEFLVMDLTSGKLYPSLEECSMDLDISVEELLMDLSTDLRSHGHWLKVV